MPRASNRHRRATVVFIAADPGVSLFYQSQLRSDGYSVTQAVNVEEASAQAVAHTPQLVFLDLGPYAPDGLLMLDELKADRCLGPVPLVLLAAFDDLDDVKEGLRLAACDDVIPAEKMPAVLARGLHSWLVGAQRLEALLA